MAESPESTESTEPTAQPARQRRRTEQDEQGEQPQQQQGEQQGEQQQPEVPVSQLIEESQGFLHYPAWVVAGALREHDPDDMMTADQAKSEIETWLQQPVGEKTEED